MATPPIIPPRGPAASEPASAAPSASASRDGDTTKSATVVKPLEGKATIDDKLNLECEILSYSAMSRIAQKIAQDFRSKVPLTGQPLCIIFLDETFKAALQVHQAFVLQATLLEQEFRHIARHGAPETQQELVESLQILGGRPVQSLAMLPMLAATGITGTTAVARSVLDLLALFRTDVSYSGRTIVIKDTALGLELAEQLKTKDTTFLYPRLMLYRPGAPSQTSSSNIAHAMEKLFDGRHTAEGHVHRIAADVAKSESQLEEMITQAAMRRDHHSTDDNERIAQFKQRVIPRRLEVNGLRERFIVLDGQLRRLRDGLSTPDPKTGILPLQLLMQAEEMLARFADSDRQTFFLWAEVASAGGSYQIRRNLFRTLFWSDGLSYSGGAIVTFAFFDRDANVVLSGTHRYRYPLTRFPGAWGIKTEGNSFDI